MMHFPYQHHTCSPATGTQVNVYSFALRPEGHQPSGTCNISCIHNARLQLVLSIKLLRFDGPSTLRLMLRLMALLRSLSTPLVVAVDESTWKEFCSIFDRFNVWRTT
mmetsp:Transcript_13225/g.16020  ORF Transcript_13225/g.16020 Transcript_13225/m.16020 type:complete len:107 (+) Transcript_13225:46-366(+)